MSKTFTSVLLIGGSTEIGFGVLNILSQRGLERVHVVGRDSNSMEEMLGRLSGIKPIVKAFSIIDEDQDKQLSKLFKDNVFDLVLIAVGQMMNQDELNASPNLVLTANEGNVNIPTIALLSTVKSLELQGYGHIAIFGSIAGDRGRKVNVIYGAGKSYLETVCQGIWQRLRNTKIKLSLIKPGPTETKISRNIHRTNVRMAKVEDVALCIVSGLLKGKKTIYSPKHWRYVMALVRILPRWIFNRTKF